MTETESLRAQLADARALLDRCNMVPQSLLDDVRKWQAANPEAPRAPLPRLGNGHAQWCAEMTMVNRECDCDQQPPEMTTIERGKAVERMFEEESPRAAADCGHLGDKREGHCFYCATSAERAAAEMAVLDACRDSEIVTDYRGRPRIRGIDQVLVAKAELARRAVKP